MTETVERRRCSEDLLTSFTHFTSESASVVVVISTLRQTLSSVIVCEVLQTVRSVSV